MNSRRKIAILLPYAERFEPAHAGAISLCVRDALAHSRFADDVTVYGRPVDAPFAGFHFQPLQPVGAWFRGRNRGLAEAFRILMRDRAVGMVEVHNRPQVFNHLARSDRRLKLALHLHNDPTDMAGLRTPAERETLLRRTSAIYCVSEYVRRRFLQGISDPGDKLHVVYNGIDRTWAEPPDKQPLILFAGRIVPEKGAHLFIEAVERVLPKFPGWRAVLLGGRRHGDPKSGSRYETDVRRRAAAMSHCVDFLGFRPHDEVMRLISKAAIVMVPSIWPEPLSRAAVEALAAGSALIATDRGGLPEVARGRGLVVNQPTVSALAEALESVIAGHELRSSLQAAAWADYPFDIANLSRHQDDLREIALMR